jgi:hypothetical protein
MRYLTYFPMLANKLQTSPEIMIVPMRVRPYDQTAQRWLSTEEFLG